MIDLIASAILTANNYNQDPEQINKFCAAVVGIPYASDNFSDEEWKRFQYCRDHLKLDN